MTMQGVNKGFTDNDVTKLALDHVIPVPDGGELLTIAPENNNKINVLSAVILLVWCDLYTN